MATSSKDVVDVKATEEVENEMDQKGQTMDQKGQTVKTGNGTEEDGTARSPKWRQKKMPMIRNQNLCKKPQKMKLVKIFVVKRN